MEELEDLLLHFIYTQETLKIRVDYVLVNATDESFTHVCAVPVFLSYKSCILHKKIGCKLNEDV